MKTLMSSFLTEEEKRTWHWIKSGPHAGRRIIAFRVADKYPNDSYYVQLASLDWECGCGAWDCISQRGCFVNVLAKDIE